MNLLDPLPIADLPALSPKPRVLMSAYQCSPGQGSVSQIGWEWYQRLSRRTRVTLVTHVRNREALQTAGAPIADSEIIYIDTEWFAGPVYRLASRLFPRSQHAVFLMSSVDFYVYDHAALGELRKRRRNGAAWDLVHAVTPVSPIASTRLHRLHLPLVLGPWNGGLRSPANFSEIMREDSAWMYPVRNLGRVLDLILGGSRRASAILSATRATRDCLPSSCGNRITQMLENGVDLDQFKPAAWPPAPGPGRPLRILFVGRLLPFKGIPMLLEALQGWKSECPVELRIVEEGPMEAGWKRMTELAGLSAVVKFCGSAPLSGIPDHLAWCHAFCLPSVRESGGAVLLEAMAAARPAIAIEYGGPAELIDDEVGKALPATGRQAVVQGLIEAFHDIVRHPDQWRARGLEGRRRAESQFGWESKIDQALSVYSRVCRKSITSSPIT